MKKSIVLLALLLLSPHVSSAVIFTPNMWLGNWTGQWNNTTFGSQGAVTFHISANPVSKTLRFTYDINGNVGGFMDPAPISGNGTYGPSGAVIPVSIPLFGSGTATLNAAGGFQLASNSSLITSIVNFNATGINNGNNSLSLNYTVAFTGGGSATGTALLQRDSISLSLNETALNSAANKTMTLTAITVASAPQTRADVYVALQLPDGTLLVMQPGGSFSTVLTPLVSNVLVPDFIGPIFNFTFSGAEPPGPYVWFAVLTQPGTLNVIGTLAKAPFTFTP